MTNPNEEIHGLLFCQIESAHDGDVRDLLRDLTALLRNNPELPSRIGIRRERLVLQADDEIHIEEARRRLGVRTGTEIGALQIALLETIRKAAEGEGKYIRQTGGSGNYGHAKVRIEPNEPGKGYEFADDIKGGVVPKEYIRSIDQGVQSALELGILAGFPMVDVKVTLYGGSYHEVDSNEMAFKFAGSMAFKDAAKNASPVLLEPVMAVEVTVPEEFMGTIIADINSRRGRIEGIEHAAGSQIVKAIVPLAEMLHSSAQGRPDYRMQFAGYEPRPRRDPFSDDAPAGVRSPSSSPPRSGLTAAEFDS